MIPPLSRVDREELLDRSDPDPRELRANLEDLQRINRRWGGNRGAMEFLGPILDRWPTDRPVRILDVGVGGGDFLMAVARRCRKRGLAASLVGLDRSPAILEFARQASRGFPEIRLVRGDALALPFPPLSFHFAACSLLLHHLRPERAVEFLAGLRTVASDGALVSDLRRGRWEYLVTLVFAAVFTRSRMTRLDAPLSVLRSLTLPEAKALAAQAGWNPERVRRCFPLRLRMDEERAP